MERLWNAVSKKVSKKQPYPRLANERKRLQLQQDSYPKHYKSYLWKSQSSCNGAKFIIAANKGFFNKGKYSRATM